MATQVATEALSRSMQGQCGPVLQSTLQTYISISMCSAADVGWPYYAVGMTLLPVTIRHTSLQTSSEAYYNEMSTYIMLFFFLSAVLNLPQLFYLMSYSSLSRISRSRSRVSLRSILQST